MNDRLDRLERQVDEIDQRLDDIAEKQARLLGVASAVGALTAFLMLIRVAQEVGIIG